MSVSDIRFGICSELAATPEYFDFKIRGTSRDGKLWVITVNSSSAFTNGGFANVVLDESFKGANAWWTGPTKGSRDVLTVIPEEEQIVLCNTSAAPPDKDGFIRLHPPRCLDALQSCWGDHDCGDPRSVANAIRPLLEGYLHRRFPGLLPKDHLFGQVVVLIRDSVVTSPLRHARSLVDELKEINDYAGQFHHDTNPDGADSITVTASELKTYVDRALSVVHKGAP